VSKLFKDLTGLMFGRWFVIKRVENNKYGQPRWLCKCNCEKQTEKIIYSNNLVSGKTQSCGCLAKELMKERLRKYNTYDLSGEYGIGYTSKGEEFYFDLEDYSKIKDNYWYKDDTGYMCSIKNKDKIYMHKIIVSDYTITDHDSRVKTDNRKVNLRNANTFENSRNSSLAKNNTSGVIGISYDIRNKKWKARIVYKLEEIWLGRFINKKDAIKARLQAEKEYFGEFAPQRHLFEEYNII
jgi:hypothetical protein